MLGNLADEIRERLSLFTYIRPNETHLSLFYFFVATFSCNGGIDEGLNLSSRQ